MKKEGYKAGTMEIRLGIALMLNVGDVIMVQSKKLFPPVCETLRVIIGGWKVEGIAIPDSGGATIETVETFKPSSHGKNWLMSLGNNKNLELLITDENPFGCKV